MPSNFRLSVVAPDRTVLDEDVESWVAPAAEGYLGVWHGHEPTLVALKPGIIEVTDPSNQRKSIAIGGGFAEIRPHSVIVLADDARLATEIDVAREEERVEEARRALRGEASTMDEAEARHQLDLALNRIRAAKGR